jgi:hypothetical protein
MPPVAKQQVVDLAAKAGAFSAVHGESVILRFQDECVLLINWLSYLSITQRTQVADTLLDGASSSIRETASCLALGLVRPALVSLRTQIDLILGWLYFKDHSVEWRSVNAFGEGFKLKREILEYLADNYKGFTTRLAILKEVAQRKTEDPYRLLSAHVHAQSVPALPSATVLADVVHGENTCEQCNVLTGEVCEYISDLLVCVYAPLWAALPLTVRKNVEERLAAGKKGTTERFFATF